jgi:hypothetical protein
MENAFQSFPLMYLNQAKLEQYDLERMMRQQLHMLVDLIELFFHRTRHPIVQFSHLSFI